MIERFTENRDRLFGIAYRMLGSIAEAEDVVQDVYLRWQAQDAAAISSVQAWLVAATTRLCIDRLRSAQRQREQYVGVWLPEPLVDPATVAPRDQAAVADSLSMAFLLMLETLSPVERAVFLLREAFDYDYEEIGGIVGKTEAACRQIVSRARRSLAQRPPALPPAPDKAEQLVQRFIAASRTGELPELLALLTDDVVLYSDGGGRAKAAGRPVLTADKVARFLIGIRRFAPPDLRTEFVPVNGRPGALVFSGSRVENVMSVEFDGDRIRAIYIVRNPDKLARVTVN